MEGWMMTDTIRVMLIEDDPMVQEVNKMFVERVPGFQICSLARNGKEGLEKITSVQPDLVLLDIFMPEQNGLETLQHLRKTEADVDVIVITAAQDKETIRAMMRLGAFDYIMKPFKFERLQHSLEKYKVFKQQLMGDGKIEQKDLDQMKGISSQPHPRSNEDLPKGLNLKTLEQVIQFMKKQSSPLSAEETAEGIGIARVTARRYLDYLVKQEQVKVKIEYGSVGRPMNLYEWK